VKIDKFSFLGKEEEKNKKKKKKGEKSSCEKALFEQHQSPRNLKILILLWIT